MGLGSGLLSSVDMAKDRRGRWLPQVRPLCPQPQVLGCGKGPKWQILKHRAETAVESRVPFWARKSPVVRAINVTASTSLTTLKSVPPSLEFRDV